MAKLIMDHTFFLQGWSSDQELTIKAIPSLTLLPSIQPFDLVADTQRIVSTELLRSKLAKCWDRLCQRWISLSSPVHQELLMCTLLTLSSFPRPGGGHTNVFVCTELLRSESELNVREDCDSCSPSFPDLMSSTSSVTITTRVYSCTHPWACRWCFRRRVIPRFFTQRQIFFPYSCPGFSGNIERNLPQRTVLAASSLAGLRCMMMSGFLSMLLCTDALVTPPLWRKCDWSHTLHPRCPVCKYRTLLTSTVGGNGSATLQEDFLWQWHCHDDNVIAIQFVHYVSLISKLTYRLKY